MTERRMPKICLFDDESFFQYQPEDIAIFKETFDVIHCDELEDDQTLCQDVQAIVVIDIPKVVSKARQWLPRLKQVQLIASISAGYNVSYSQLKEFRLPIAYNGGAMTEGTATHAVALMLAIGCGLISGMTSAQWADVPSYLPANFRHPGVCTATLGIVGLGRIGSSIARKCRVFNMEIYYHNRKRKSAEEEESLGVIYFQTLHDMLPQCDYIIVACSLTPETTNLFGETEFRLMKSSACFINVSRGQVVDSLALAAALSEGRIYQAALDVTEPEPLPPGHPLLGLNNVIITPHSACINSVAIKEAVNMTVCNLRTALIDHKTPPFLVPACTQDRPQLL